MKIFLAAPFTDKINPATKLIQGPYREFLERIIQFLQGRGYHVSSAHLREDWGAKLEPPGVAIENDLNSVRECDVLVAYPGNPPSPGVQMELGFAVAFRKPIIVFHEKQSRVPYLVEGMGKLTQVSEISFVDNQDLLERLGTEIVNAVKFQ